MRWQGQELGVADSAALPGLEQLNGLVRSVTTPEFADVTFHEVMCKSALNHVPGASGMPFDWTVNPYRGCTHACSYCFARGTHEYLELDAGHDFDTQIVVKINVADVLAKELRRGTWMREPVMLGTNTDPYQRAEGRYRLMPGIVSALAESGTPFSILTKGTLLRRDLPLLREAAASVPVSVAMSIAVFDDALQRLVEPGTPSAAARLDTVRAATEAGSSSAHCTCDPAPSSGSCSGSPASIRSWSRRTWASTPVRPRRRRRPTAPGCPNGCARCCACTASTARPRRTPRAGRRRRASRHARLCS
jgi:hypothetical protein